MNRYVRSALLATLGAASMTCALAQEPTSPPPSSRESTAAQTPAPRTTDQSTTTSPSQQRQAAASKESHKQMMKDCVAKEQANNTGMTESQAKKACKAQMKSNSSSSKNY